MTDEESKQIIEINKKTARALMDATVVLTAQKILVNNFILHYFASDPDGADLFRIFKNDVFNNIGVLAAEHEELVEEVKELVHDLEDGLRNSASISEIEM